MGIAWHEHVLIAFALLLKFREEVAHRLSHLADFIAREKLEVNEHLVVARASAMYFLPHVAQFAGEHEFHLRMHVFDTILNDKIARLCHLIDGTQFAKKNGQFLVGNQADAVQHRDVCHRAKHVILRQIKIEFAVMADREAVNLFRHMNRLLPKFRSVERVFVIHFPSEN